MLAGFGSVFPDASAFLNGYACNSSERINQISLIAEEKEWPGFIPHS
jgi:hypothetical protein